MIHMAIEEHSLLIPPRLARFLGKNEAVLLQQVHYWLQKTSHIIRDLPWIYNTYKQWGEQIIFLSVSTIRRAFKRLRELELIRVEQHEKKLWKRRLWYTIDYEKLAQLNTSMCSTWTHREIQTEQLDILSLNTSSITETSSETSLIKLTATTDAAKSETSQEQNLERSRDNFSVEPVDDLDVVSTKQQNTDRDQIVPPPAQNDETPQKLIQLGIQPNQVVGKMIQRFPDRLQNALAYVEQQIKSPQKWVKNPTAVFVDALKNCLQPEPYKSAPNSIQDASTEIMWRRFQARLATGDLAAIEECLNAVLRSSREQAIELIELLATLNSRWQVQDGEVFLVEGGS